jgi:serine/threonine-protein kinase
MLGHVFLGKYKVTRLLDEGGMGKIYLARQLDRDREVAVKVLKDGLRGQAKTREHFPREIHIMSRFQHPHAVAYYDADPNNALGPVLIMEYLRGTDLNLLIQRGSRFTPERTGRLLGQLCEVLQAAHEAGIVHRDIKPGNLMILYPSTPQETVKLMDFGLAKMSSGLYISPDELVDFSSPTTAGTPEYMAPEQVHGQDIDARGDLYAVGVILFEMLTGHRPFEHTSVQALLQAHADEPPPSFADKGMGDMIAPAVESVVRMCLAKSPDRRPQSARELAMRYEQAVGRKITSGPRSGVVPALSRSESGLVRTPLPSQEAGRQQQQATTTVVRAVDRHAVQHRVEVNMPEAMAMLKLRGFIQDLGGQVVESVPGLIRVRLDSPTAAQPKKPSGGLFSWGEKGRQPSLLETVPPTDLELRMERKDPGQINRLTISLLMRSATSLITPEWRSRCIKIGRDLEAYLMGR